MFQIQIVPGYTGKRRYGTPILRAGDKDAAAEAAPVVTWVDESLIDPKFKRLREDETVVDNAKPTKLELTRENLLAEVRKGDSNPEMAETFGTTEKMISRARAKWGLSLTDIFGREKAKRVAGTNTRSKILALFDEMGQEQWEQLKERVITDERDVPPRLNAAVNDTAAPTPEPENMEQEWLRKTEKLIEQYTEVRKRASEALALYSAELRKAQEKIDALTLAIQPFVAQPEQEEVLADEGTAE